MRIQTMILPLAALALAGCGDGATAPAAAVGAVAPLHAAAERGIPGEYIVVLKEGASAASVSAVAGVHPRLVFETALNGFAAPLSPAQLTALRHHPSVAYVEQDRAVRAEWTQPNAPWGLDRIDQHFLPLNTTYVYNNLATPVTAYVLDTGIRTGHAEFGGRAFVAYDAFGGNGQDCHGHGTGVAGVVGAKTYGVAKGVRLASVRVLDCNGSGTMSGIIGAVNWVAANFTKPAVANLSFGGGASLALNSAVDNLFNAGVFVASAAGNSNANACNYSPSGAASSTTVASSDMNDNRVTSSNWGSCVALYAPGRSIPTVGLSTTPILANGTSIAAPHVAGTAALVMSVSGNSSPVFARSWIINNATPNVIIGNPLGTPNRLLFKGTL